MPPKPIEKPFSALAWRSWEDAWAELRKQAQNAQVHLGQVVVLLPHMALQAPAQQAWRKSQGSGFVPRFETLHSWLLSLGHLASLQTPPSDWLQALHLLRQAGLRDAARGLVPQLLQAQQQIRQKLASLPPLECERWVQQARAELPLNAAESHPGRQLETALLRLALEWAEQDPTPNAAVWQERTVRDTPMLVVVQGLGDDTLARHLVQHWQSQGQHSFCMRLTPEPTAFASPRQQRQQRHWPCADAPSETTHTTACVLSHLLAERQPVALVAVDRMLTRSVHAQLLARGVRIRDESGWKLSTTRAAARLMGLLRGLGPSASRTEILDALQNAPALNTQAVQTLERHWRRKQLGQGLIPRQDPAVATLWQQWQSWQAWTEPSQPLSAWRAVLQNLLRQSGLWAELAQDAAGQTLLALLQQQAPDQTPVASNETDRGSCAESATTTTTSTSAAQMHLPWHELLAWLDHLLESQVFLPAAPALAQVHILPLGQLPGRDFAAVVMAGCDEISLPAAPEPTGLWTPQQRKTLGLPTREDQARWQAQGFEAVFHSPWVDLLWREQDQGEVRNPSPLVLLHQLHQQRQAQEAQQTLSKNSKPASNATARHPTHSVVEANTEAGPALEPCPWTTVVLPLHPPQGSPSPQIQDLPLPALSASAYEDLRSCPYRFFALHLLALQTQQEWSEDIDKSDFGSWLHAVLQHFHNHSRGTLGSESASLQAALDASAQAIGMKDAARDSSFHWSSPAFLPFATIWPMWRDAYIDWLQKHEAQGHRFVAAEKALQAPWPHTDAALPALMLKGRIDRIDVDAAGRLFIIDYKTGSRLAIKDRIKHPEEDVQLPFYAELLAAANASGDWGIQPGQQEDEQAALQASADWADETRAAYLSLSERPEREPPESFEHAEWAQVRARFREGLQQDWQQITQGQPLAAIGQGDTCEHCAARGLCRRDFV